MLKGFSWVRKAGDGLTPSPVPAEPDNHTETIPEPSLDLTNVDTLVIDPTSGATPTGPDAVDPETSQLNELCPVDEETIPEPYHTPEIGEGEEAPIADAMPEDAAILPDPAPAEAEPVGEQFFETETGKKGRKGK